MAFVLGGGGILGASEVGMLRALLTAGIRPDLVVGTSVGAINGAVLSADPTIAGVDRLAAIWAQVAEDGVFTESWWTLARRVARFDTHLNSADSLQALLDAELHDARIEELAVRFECVAAQIETASARWFDEGPVVDAVLASCAVPGLLPAKEVDGAHYLDGGLVHSIPVARAVEHGARTVYVLQVGRIEHALTPPKRAWEVGVVAFEISRRYRFNEEISRIPAGVEVHLLPTGSSRSPSVTLSYKGARQVRDRIDAAAQACAAYLADPTPLPTRTASGVSP